MNDCPLCLVSTPINLQDPQTEPLEYVAKDRVSTPINLQDSQTVG